MKHLLIFYFLVFLTACKSKDESNSHAIAEKELLGFWADTAFTYKFNKDGTFVFKSKGHYGNSSEYGIYTILDDLILLVPNTDWKAFDGVLKTKLKIMSSSCIRDFNDHYYCLANDLVNYYSDQVNDFQEKTIDILTELPDVVSLKRDIFKYDTDKETNIVIAYVGITVIEKNEFHSFILKNTSMLNNRTYSSFLVKKNPFEIYQYNLKGNSLRLLYKAD
ncbi:MAG TPA: hypothetical protein PLZ12_05110 [Saprospiraceae bacterium]|nr:hypothetical protein [Saprospiraceae bacterium]